ncbi:hypothetical protein J4221_00035 [Candidatus Pacearchaeota archaeon]|nr:hypothetical protein [Candidatus Pacearchaeota archaeon]
MKGKRYAWKYIEHRLGYGFSQPSVEIPQYIGETDLGNEIYMHEERLVEVRAGEIIDSHGNIFDLRALLLTRLIRGY